MKVPLIITPIRVPKVLERTAVSHTETTKNGLENNFQGTTDQEAIGR